MFKSRIATIDDLEEIMKLEKRFETDLFFVSDIADAIQCLNSGKSIVCTSSTGKIVAFILISVTEYKTAYVEKIFVSPIVRGNKLQQYLTTEAIDMLEPIACYTMVSPKNKISLYNLKKCGFKEKVQIKYKGDSRIILAYEVNS